MKALATLALTILCAAQGLGFEQTAEELLSTPRLLAPVVDITDIVEPLADLIGEAESDNVGGYDAANTGRAMDLGRDGFTRYFGESSSAVTVQRIMDSQRWGDLHAVGRYQIIGSTMREIVNDGCISPAELFTPEVQDRAFVCLLQTKRPAVWSFIVGEGSSYRAANALAKEWSSMPWTDGRTYYGSGDHAHATRGEVIQALNVVRRNALASPEVL